MVSQTIIHNLHEFHLVPNAGEHIAVFCSLPEAGRAEVVMEPHGQGSHLSQNLRSGADMHHQASPHGVCCDVLDLQYLEDPCDTLLAHRLTRLNSLGFALAPVREAPVNFKRAVQPVGQDVLHKLQMKKDKWRRQAKLDAVEELLWGRQPHHSLKQRLCAALGRIATSLLHDASLALEDLSIVIAPGQTPKVQ